MPFVTQAVDNFNRANETPLAAPWATMAEGSHNLASNVAVPGALGSDQGMRHTGRTWANDQSSKGKLTVTGTAGGGVGPGLCVRAAAAGPTYYRVVADHGASNNVQLGRIVAAAFTSLALFTRAFSDGDEWELTVQGPAAAAALKVYHAGTLVQTVVDNSSIASGSPGLAYSSTVSSASVNDWSGGELAPDIAKTFTPIPFMR